MLFDLRSPARRNTIRVIYGLLAVLMGGGLIFFGIGGNVSGGFLSDVGGGGGGDGNPFEDDIEAAEERLAQNPQDVNALGQLVQFHFQAGSSQIEVDQETGAQSLTDEGNTQLQQAAESWDRYLKASQKQGQKPATGVSAVAFQTFSVLADTSFSEALTATSGTDALDSANTAVSDWGDAAAAQRILAEATPNAQAYARLADLLYRSGDIAAGDQAAAQATQQAKPNEKAALEQQLKQSKKQGEQLADAIAQLQKQQQQTQQATGGANPLEGLGGGGLGGGSGLSTP
jgi:hypothetical protein